MGTLPSSIGNFAKLTEVGFGSNGNISGTIPSSMGELSELQYLAMDNNRLRGSIPPEIAKLHKLTFFWLAVNQLTGMVPMLPWKQYNSPLAGGDSCNMDALDFVCPLPAGAAAPPCNFTCTPPVPSDCPPPGHPGLVSFQHAPVVTKDYNYTTSAISNCEGCGCNCGVCDIGCACTTNPHCFYFGAVAGEMYLCTHNNCTGNSTNLAPAQCNAWIDFYDATGGSAWKDCRDDRTDPLSCSGVASNAAGTSLTAM